MSALEDTMSMSGDVQYIGRYHDTCGGISRVQWRMINYVGEYHDSCEG